MFCRNCGKEISSSACFCKYCGAKLRSSTKESLTKENTTVIYKKTVSLADTPTILEIDLKLEDYKFIILLIIYLRRT